MHPVESKLRTELIPYFVSAEKLRWRLLYVAYEIYAYASDLLAALVGLGFASPILQAMQGNKIELQGLPVMGVVALLIWITLKIYISRNEGEKRSTLAKSCRRQFRKFSAELNRGLATPTPMPQLVKLQEEITSLVDRHIMEDAWPWAPLAKNIESRVEREVKALCDQYGSGWAKPPAA